MDSKTRVLTVLSHNKPDRVPFNFWMDRRLLSEYEKKYNHRHWRVTHYGADVIETFAGLTFPEGPSIEKDGTVWHTGPAFEKWDNIDSIQLPDANDEKVYELIQADISEFPDKAIFLDMITPWGVIAGMRTYQQIYMDMYEYPEEFKKLSVRIQSIMKIAVERACKMGITALYLMEDLATTKGLSMSPAMIKEFCLDYAKPLIEIAASYNKPVLFHSDGNVSNLIDLLLDYEICAVNPLQPHINNLPEFKSKYGQKMAVYGGLDNCFIIPNGSPDEIRAHINDIFETLGRPDGGLIFSTHDIPLHTPPTNVEAMVSAIKNCIY